MSIKVPSYDPKDREFASWARAVTASLNDIEKRVTFAWNSDDAPVSVRSGVVTLPAAIRVLDAKTDLGAHVGGAAISWTWDNGTIVISAIGTLTASTDYTVTIGLVT